MKHYLTTLLILLNCTAYSMYPKLILLAKVAEELDKNNKQKENYKK